MLDDRSEPFRPATDADRTSERVRRLRGEQQRPAAEVSDGWRWIPDRLIPAQGRSDDRLIQYGYQRYRELFNPRQLLHLSVLAEAIANAMDGPDARGLGAGIQRPPHHQLYADPLRLRLASSGPAVLHPCLPPRLPCPVEINPWLDGTGRGTFPNTVRQVQRAIEFAQAPEVAHLDGGFVRSGSLAANGAASRTIHNADSRFLVEVADQER